MIIILENKLWWMIAGSWLLPDLQKSRKKHRKIFCALLALFLTTGGNIRRHAIFSAEPIVLTHFGQTLSVLLRSYLVNTPQVSPRWRIFLSFEHIWQKHRLNLELDLQSLFGLHLHSCIHWPRPHTPPPPHLGSYRRALLFSQDRQHLFVTVSNMKLIYKNENFELDEWLQNYENYQDH